MGTVYTSAQQPSSPGKWETPQSVKNAYAALLAANKSYDRQLAAAAKMLSGRENVGDTSQFASLVDAYNRDYQSGAALAAQRGERLGDRADAGFGNSYAGAVADQAYSDYMARRGDALPALFAAGAKAYDADRSARAATIGASQKSAALKSGALEAAFSAQLSTAAKAAAARRKAYGTLVSGLEKKSKITA